MHSHELLRIVIRQIIKETVCGGSHPEEAYNKKLIDDPSFNSKSVYVKDEWKAAIKKWLKDMKLD
jgi:hypothetical protein